MFPENRILIHPGEVLLEEFLKPLEVSLAAFAQHISVSLQRINEVVRGKRDITPDTTWRFAQNPGTTPEFWIDLQSAYDLARSRPAELIELLFHLHLCSQEHYEQRNIFPHTTLSSRIKMLFRLIWNRIKL